MLAESSVVYCIEGDRDDQCQWEDTVRWPLVIYLCVLLANAVSQVTPNKCLNTATVLFCPDSVGQEFGEVEHFFYSLCCQLMTSSWLCSCLGSPGRCPYWSGVLLVFYTALASVLGMWASAEHGGLRVVNAHTSQRQSPVLLLPRGIGENWSQRWPMT